MAFLLTPGSLELVENAAHLLSTGHTAHGIDDAEHAPQGEEHDCSGIVHVCKCHSSMGFVITCHEAVVAEPKTFLALSHWQIVGAPASRYITELFRPPAA